MVVLQAGCHHIMEPRMIRSEVADYSRHLIDFVVVWWIKASKTKVATLFSGSVLCICKIGDAGQLGCPLSFTTRPCRNKLP
jgi:hypothetical protein